MRRAARLYARQHFVAGKDSRGHNLPLLIKNPTLGATIALGPAGVEHATHVGRTLDHFRVVPALPELLRHAVKSREPHSDRKDRPEIRAIHHVAAPLMIGERLYAVQMVLRETPQHRFFYEHDLTELLPIGDAPGESAEAETTATDARRKDPPGVQMKVGELLAQVKGNLRKATEQIAAGQLRFVGEKAPSQHRPRQLQLLREGVTREAFQRGVLTSGDLSKFENTPSGPIRKAMILFIKPRGRTP
jgi:hypothetical protein